MISECMKDINELRGFCGFQESKLARSMCVCIIFVGFSYQRGFLLLLLLLLPFLMINDMQPSFSTLLGFSFGRKSKSQLCSSELKETQLFFFQLSPRLIKQELYDYDAHKQLERNVFLKVSFLENAIYQLLFFLFF